MDNFQYLQLPSRFTTEWWIRAFQLIDRAQLNDRYNNAAVHQLAMNSVDPVSFIQTRAYIRSFVVEMIDEVNFWLNAILAQEDAIAAEQVPPPSTKRPRHGGAGNRRVQRHILWTVPHADAIREIIIMNHLTQLLPLYETLYQDLVDAYRGVDVIMGARGTRVVSQSDAVRNARIRHASSQFDQLVQRIPNVSR
jgi:hypothetical protein